MYTVPGNGRNPPKKKKKLVILLLPVGRGPRAEFIPYELINFFSSFFPPVRPGSPRVYRLPALFLLLAYEFCALPTLWCKTVTRDAPRRLLPLRRRPGRPVNRRRDRAPASGVEGIANFSRQIEKTQRKLLFHDKYPTYGRDAVR